MNMVFVKVISRVSMHATVQSEPKSKLQESVIPVAGIMQTEELDIEDRLVGFA